MIEPRHRGLLGGIFAAKNRYHRLVVPGDTAIAFSSVSAGRRRIKTLLSFGCQGGSQTRWVHRLALGCDKDAGAGSVPRRRCKQFAMAGNAASTSAAKPSSSVTVEACSRARRNDSNNSRTHGSCFAMSKTILRLNGAESIRISFREVINPHHNRCHSEPSDRGVIRGESGDGAFPIADRKSRFRAASSLSRPRKIN